VRAGVRACALARQRKIKRGGEREQEKGREKKTKSDSERKKQTYRERQRTGVHQIIDQSENCCSRVCILIHTAHCNTLQRAQCVISQRSAVRVYVHTYERTIALANVRAHAPAHDPPTVVLPRTNKRTCICMHTHTNAHTHIQHTYSSLASPRLAHIHTDTHADTHTPTHAHAHAHAHTYIYTHTHNTHTT